MSDYANILESYMIDTDKTATEGIGLAMVGGMAGLAALSAIYMKYQEHKKAKSLSAYATLTTNIVNKAKEIKISEGGSAALNMCNTKLPQLVKEFNNLMNQTLSDAKASKTGRLGAYTSKFEELGRRADDLLTKCTTLIDAKKESHDATDNKVAIQKYVDIVEDFKYPEAADDFGEVFENDDETPTEISTVGNAAFNTNRKLYRIYLKVCGEIKLRLK